MNIKEYISSGAVESYVLGLLTAQDRFEFEQLADVHPELKEARDAFELAVEKLVMEKAIAPPADLKQKIASQIFVEKKKSAPVIPIETTPGKKFSWSKFAVAASIILLVGSVWWNMSLRNENKTLRANNDTLQNNLKISEDHNAQLVADANAIQKGGMKLVGLGGTANSPKSLATVYWDTTSHDVYLLVNNLPKPASDEQYQLWAILKNNNQLQTIDLGFIELTQKPLQVYKMTNAQAAQAFAITLEKKDGNPAPNLDKIYVMGNL